MLQQNNIFYHVNYVKIKNYKKYGKTLSKFLSFSYKHVKFSEFIDKINQIKFIDLERDSI